MSAHNSDLIAAVQTDKAFSLTALGIAQICSWGSLYYSFPQLAQALTVEMSWLKSELYGALTLALLMSALAALPTGMLIDKGYGRQVMSGGSILAGVVFLLGSQINSLVGFYLSFALIGFLHAATLYEAAFAVIAHRFNSNEAKALITKLTLWGGFAATVFIPLNEFILKTFDWRALMQILGLINIFVCALIYSQLPAAKIALLNPKAKPPVRVERGLTWALTQPIFWLLLFCFAIFGATTTAFKFHLYPLLLEQGVSSIEVVALVALLGPSQVSGRLLLALFAKRISMISLGVVTALALPLVFLAVAYLPPNILVLAPFMILFGVATGTMTIIKGVAVPELLSKQAYGAINGAMNLPVKLIKAFSPALVAAIWAISHDYHSVLEILVGLGIITSLCFAVASKLNTSYEPD